MNKETIIIARHRFSRAKESLEEALLLFQNAHYNTYVNRLYYSCFYAVSALLLIHGKSSAKHSGIRSMFHQMFVKNGLLEQTDGLLYDRLFDNRQKADYADLISFDAAEIQGWSREVQSFLEKIKRICEQEISEHE